MICNIDGTQYIYCDAYIKYGKTGYKCIQLAMLKLNEYDVCQWCFDHQDRIIFAPRGSNMSHTKEGCPTFELKEGGKKKTFETGAQKENSREIDGKGAYDLLPTIPIRRIAEIYRKGAIKYAPYNYAKGLPLSRFLDSAKRHLDQFAEGMEDEDHLSMACWHLMGLIHTQEMIRRGILPEELNDLPSMGINGTEIEVYPGCKCSKWRKPAKGLEVGKQKDKLNE